MEMWRRGGLGRRAWGGGSDELGGLCLGIPRERRENHCTSLILFSV